MFYSFLQQLPKWSILAAIALLLPSNIAQAEPAPQRLTQLLSELETAANNNDVETVQAAYTGEFTTSSGLNRQELAQKLQQLWETYDRLDYQIQLESWEQRGNTLVAQTVTQIRGQRQGQDQEILLEAVLRSRQRIQNGKIISQDMISERSQLYIGENAPRVKVNAPNTIQVGEEFNFDVIVREPVGDDILLGTALEEEVTANRYLIPQKLDLEILPAGGIYRLGEAPTRPGKRWLSAIIVRDDGMTLVSHRLNIVPQQSALSNSRND